MNPKCQGLRTFCHSQKWTIGLSPDHFGNLFLSLRSFIHIFIYSLVLSSFWQLWIELLLCTNHSAGMARCSFRSQNCFRRSTPLERIHVCDLTVVLSLSFLIKLNISLLNHHLKVLFSSRSPDLSRCLQSIQHELKGGWFGNHFINRILVNGFTR